MTQKSLGQLLKNAEILRQAAKLTNQFSGLNSTILQILKFYYLENKVVNVELKRGRTHVIAGYYDEYRITWGRFQLVIPVREFRKLDLGVEQKVRNKMNANAKTNFRSQTGLFDELSLSEAIAVYFRVQREHYPQGIDDVEELDDIMVQLQIDLFNLAAEVLTDTPMVVKVKDTSKDGGYKEDVVGIDAAWIAQRKLSDLLLRAENGNAITRAWFETEYGILFVPPYRANYMSPIESAAADLTEERLQEIISRPQREEEQIQLLWGRIVAAYAQSPEDRPEQYFHFGENTYSVSLSPNTSSADRAGIKWLEAPNAFGLPDRDFVPHLRSGMLAAWAEFVSPKAIAARRIALIERLPEAHLILDQIKAALEAMGMVEQGLKQPLYSGQRIQFPKSNKDTQIRYGYNGFIPLVKLLDNGTLAKWLEQVTS